MKKKKSDSLVNRIGDEFVKKDLRKNIEYYKKLLKQSKSDSSKKIDAIALSNIAISYYKLDQPDESIKFFLQALDYIDKDGQIIDTINILNKIGNICEQQANFMYARKVYREKLELEKKLDNFENIVVTLKKLGQFNMNLSDYDKAIKNYLSALKIIEDNGLEINSIDLYTQIGIIKTKTKNYVVAKEYFEKSLVKVEVKNLIDFGNALNSYAKLDIQNTDYETAKKKIEAAIKIFTTKNHRDGIIQTYKTMGQLLHIQKKYRKAISYFLKVKAMLSEEQNSFEVATIHYLLGSVYLDSGEEENANDEFQSSLFLAKYYDLKELMKDNYLKISKYFQQTHIDTLALEYYKSYSEIKDEILNEKNLQKVSEMRMVFEIEKKEKELKQITSDYNHTKIEKDILNAIVNSIPHPISIKDVNSNYIKTNKEFAHLFNLTPEEMLDKNISEIHDKKLAKVMKEEDVLVKSEKKIMQFEIENEEIDKSLFITKAPLLLNDETTGIVTTIIDISGQKNIQKKLETSENMLKIKNGEKDKFFSILAHDLKNPLSGMIVTLQYLENNFQNIEVNKTKKFISNLNMGINNISNLLEDLLKWSGAQTGRLAFFSIEMDIYKICEEIIKLFSSQSHNKNIEVINNIDAESTIKGDINMVSTIIRNLLSNAIKFTFEDGKIEFNNFEDDDYTGFSIKDSGKGMNQHQIKNVFSVGNAKTYSTNGTNHEEGTGLGLPICLEFIKLHNGKIEVESVNGTTFIVKFPKVTKIQSK